MAKEVAKENDAQLHPVAAFITNSINVVMTVRVVLVNLTLLKR